jgi:hypothetical protein
MVLDTLSPGMIGESGFFNVDYVLRTLREHMLGRKNHRRFLWGVLMFLLWYRVHYKATTPSV